MRRVVVTGLGMVSPLGCGVETTWNRLLNSESGARRIETFDVSDLPSKIACVVPRGDGSKGTFNPDQWMEPKDQRKVDDFIIFAMAAARQALDDANWHPSTEEDRCATGTMIGSGIGGLSGIADTALLLKERGPRKVSPFFIPGRLINLASGYVSIEHGLKGPNHAVVTACSTGAHAIGDASRLIMLGDADVMVAGGTESPICRHWHGRILRGAARCRPASTKRLKGPRARTTRIVTVSSWARAPASSCSRSTSMPKRRGAKIYAEVIGYGLVRRCLSHHLSLAGRRRRIPQHERRDEARRHHACRHRLHQRAWHLDAGRRRDRARRGGAAVGQCRFQDFDVVHQVVDRASAGCGRGGRGDFQHPGDSRQHRPADHQSRKSCRWKRRSIWFRTAPRKREINVALSNSFGFGGTNASVIVQRLTN